MNPNYEDVLRRHAIPEILFAPDIALSLDIPEAEADERARQGDFGPRFLVGGRVAVLRQDFLDHLVDLSATADGPERDLLSPRLRALREEDGHAR